MTSEITELMKIGLYLLLSFGGGIMIAVLGILLIIVIGAVGALVGAYTASSKKRTNPLVTNRNGRRRSQEDQSVHFASSGCLKSARD